MKIYIQTISKEVQKSENRTKKISPQKKGESTQRRSVKSPKKAKIKDISPKKAKFQEKSASRTSAKKSPKSEKPRHTIHPKKQGDERENLPKEDQSKGPKKRK